MIFIRSRKVKYIVLILLLLAVIVFLFLIREKILVQAGKALFKNMEIEKSDAIMVLRGDYTYRGILEVVRLFKMGYADNIIVSAALEDDYIRKLKDYFVEIPTGQERLFSILLQLGVPEEKIFMDKQAPGGGTEAELKRIENVMKERGYNKIIIITNWWHTKRTYLMAREIFKKDNLKFFVLSSKNNVSSFSNWWKHRYESLYVFEEFPKLFFLYLNKILRISFDDDPNIN